MATEILKAEQKALKKFLVQRTILDSFRLYLDISTKFIRALEESKLLTKDELYLIKVRITYQRLNDCPNNSNVM